MAKILCILSLAISALLLVVFFLDVLIGIPFGRFNMMLDIAFIVCAGSLGTMSFFCFRQQK